MLLPLPLRRRGVDGKDQRDLERVVPKALFLIEAGRSVAIWVSSSGYLGVRRPTGPTLAFPVPLALAPPRRRTYGRGELHARAARRLLLTQPAAPSPLPPCDALRFGARAATTNLGLTMPATSRSQVRLLPSRSRETRPLPLVPHPYTERTRPIAPTLFRREPSDAARSLANRCPAPVRAPRTRESVPVVATLTPRRAARRCGNDLARSSHPLSL